MLMNKQTNGFLVFDMSDRITSHDEAYACTSRDDKEMGPSARSVFIIRRAEPSGGDTIIKYGQKIKLESNPYILNKPLYLNSC